MALTLDPNFLWLIVHDLRNPLNVIGLTLRLIEDSLPKDDPEARADLGVLNENVAQMERLLKRLADYSRLSDPDSRLDIAPFDPRRLVDDLVEEHAMQSRAGSPRPVVEVAEGTPPHVELDPSRARQAIQAALANAAAAAEGGPIRIALRGGAERLIVEVRTDVPPRETVVPLALRPDRFERLAGTSMERSGLELALAARVAELFGGSARLDVEPGRGTAIVFDWPTRVEVAA